MITPEELIKKWLAALRSGKYKQGANALHNLKDNSFCCLGVLCKIATEEAIITPTGKGFLYGREVMTYEHELTALPTTLRDFLNITRLGQLENELPNLTYMNDKLNYDFNKIADLIEKNGFKKTYDK